MRIDRGQTAGSGLANGFVELAETFSLLFTSGQSLVLDYV